MENGKPKNGMKMNENGESNVPVSARRGRGRGQTRGGTRFSPALGFESLNRQRGEY
jgi:hypothetical protein